MRALFADLPEACDNTLAIARRCAFMPEPRKPILPLCTKLPAAPRAEAVRAMARAASSSCAWPAGRRRRARQAYAQRLDYELDVIEQMGFSGYFLIVADFIQWAKAQRHSGRPGPRLRRRLGRRLGATITDLDPLRLGLLFERFLNPERVSMPDFDIDFCQERRDEVIRYVATNTAPTASPQIITFGKLQARAALRDVGRVLGCPTARSTASASWCPTTRPSR